MVCLLLGSSLRYRSCWKLLAFSGLTTSWHRDCALEWNELESFLLLRRLQIAVPVHSIASTPMLSLTVALGSSDGVLQDRLTVHLFGASVAREDWPSRDDFSQVLVTIVPRFLW